VAGALAALGTGEPAVDVAAGRVILPVAGGAGVLSEVACRLAAAQLRVTALALRRPTLEEAFLAVTGQPASGPPAARPGPAHQTRSTP
jgi:ABC-2 type transport system ATP-binding protein